jgi:hypothetical protein
MRHKVTDKKHDKERALPEKWEPVMAEPCDTK